MKLNERPAVDAVIPAEPGWRICVPVYDGEGSKIGKVASIALEPVLAWHVEIWRDGKDGQTVTRTCAAIGAEDSNDWVWLVTPDGKIFRPDDRELGNVFDGGLQRLIDLLNHEGSTTAKDPI